MGLDARGDISIALVVIYVIVFLLALPLVLRHGFSRDAGWVFLLIFAALRIIGGALDIAAEQTHPPSKGLYITALSFETAGTGPLLLCTMGFLGLIASYSLAPLPLMDTKIFRIIKLLILVALILVIYGASQSASTDSSKRNTAQTLRRVGAILLLIAFIVIAAIHGLFWTHANKILRHHRTLLIGVSLAIPFLTVRIIYSVLSAFSPNTAFSSSGATTTSTNGLSKFNLLTGSWHIWLVMSLIMEFIVIALYLAFGSLLPLSREETEEEKTGRTQQDGLPTHYTQNGPQGPPY